MTNVKVELACAKCGHQLSKPASKFETVEGLDCPVCGGRLVIDKAKLSAATKKNVDAAQQLARKLARLKKPDHP